MRRSIPFLACSISVLLACSCSEPLPELPDRQAADSNGVRVSYAEPPSLPLEQFSVALLPNESLGGLGKERAVDGERYAHRVDNGFLAAEQNPLSTFSIDVDTASYTNLRRMLRDGITPPADAIRIEELLNYFRYDDPLPSGPEPFSVSTQLASCPWAADHQVLRVALRATPPEYVARRSGNFVFLIDVSGSMASPDKLPLVKTGLKLLARQLQPSDSVAIVVYAGAAGLVLPATAGSDRAAIDAAIDALDAGGSTAGGAGIELAYRIAREQFIAGGINRVILATDGDFNVGVSSDAELTRLIEKHSKSGVLLTVLGFGVGNLNDSAMEALADHGNGQYAYIDSEQEARRALVELAGGALITLAQDVKLQIEFNPAVVSSYRLIGYENRLLAAEDFRDDRKDAGEIGAGHAVIALYEVVPVGVNDATVRPVDPLEYQASASITEGLAGELATVKWRYKPPGEAASIERAAVIPALPCDWSAATADLRFSAAVAAFGMVLRDSPHRGSADLTSVRQWAEGALGSDPGGERSGFVALTTLAERLQVTEITSRAP